MYILSTTNKCIYIYIYYIYTIQWVTSDAKTVLTCLLVRLPCTPPSRTPCVSRQGWSVPPVQRYKRWIPNRSLSNTNTAHTGHSDGSRFPNFVGTKVTQLGTNKVLIACVCLRWCFTFYHGIHHHFSHLFGRNAFGDIFQPPNKALD